MIRDVKKVQNFVPIKNVFISLFNKENSVMLVHALFKICPDVTIFSSGGTYSHLEKFFPIHVRDKKIIQASEYTGMPEADGGLVKTLHHKLFLGYLTETFSELHQEDLKRENAVAIDLVIVDLYPFDEVVKKEGVTAEECRGNIDVGGPSALRAGVKNFLRVMTIAKAGLADYNNFISELALNNGCSTLNMRLKGAKDTFKVLSEYDTHISDFFAKLTLDEILETYKLV